MSSLPDVHHRCDSSGFLPDDLARQFQIHSLVFVFQASGRCHCDALKKNHPPACALFDRCRVVFPARMAFLAIHAKSFHVIIRSPLIQPRRWPAKVPGIGGIDCFYLRVQLPPHSRCAAVHRPARIQVVARVAVEFAARLVSIAGNQHSFADERSVVRFVQWLAGRQ